MKLKNTSEIIAITDKGKIRILNEDCFTIIRDRNLAVIVDGAGGHSQGDFASRIIVDTIEDFYFSDDDIVNNKILVQVPSEINPQAKDLIAALRIANYRLFKINDIHSENSQLLKKKALAALCAISFDMGLANIVHVGDARVYRVRDNNIEKMTKDHLSTVKETKNGRTILKEYLTRAMGFEEGIYIDLKICDCHDNDIFLLCTDGLYRMVPEDQILDIIKNHSDDIEKASKKLIDLSNEKGGLDNITIAMIKYKDASLINPNNKNDVYFIKPFTGHHSDKILLNSLKKIYFDSKKEGAK